MKLRFTIWFSQKMPEEYSSIVQPAAPNPDAYGCSLIMSTRRSVKGEMVYKWVYEAEDYNLNRHQFYKRCKRWSEYTRSKVVVGEWGPPK